MRVQDVGGFGEQLLAKLQNTVGVSNVLRRQGKGLKSLETRRLLKVAPFRRYDHLIVLPFAQAPRQPEQLPLPAAQFVTGIDMNNLHARETRNWKLEIRNSRAKRRPSQVRSVSFRLLASDF